MKDIGIGMTPANRQAIVEGRKTMTRRLCKVQPPDNRRWQIATCLDMTGDRRNMGRHSWVIMDGNSIALQDSTSFSPPYAVGQRLYIREPYYRYGKWLKNGLTKKTERQAWRFEPVEPYIPVREKTDGFLYMDDAPPRVVQKLSYRGTGWYKRSPLFMPKKFARTWLLVTDVKAPERGKDISPQDIRSEGVIRKETTFCYLAIEMWEKLLTSIYGVGAMEKWYWPIEFEKVEKE